MRFSELKKASLVGAFFVSVFFSLQAAALCSVSERLPRMKVARVIDGDTLRLVDGRSVRLIGLNATEMGRDGRRAEPFAEAARSRLQSLVSANDGYVAIRPGQQPKDHYGRVLAHVFDRHGENMEALMLAEGLGFFVAIAPNVSLVDCHRKAERQARSARKGVWRQLPVINAERVRSGGFAIVRGRVEHMETNRGGVWLELGSSLVVQIPPHAVAAFDDALGGLAGKGVEVRGWVIDRKRRGDRSLRARWLLKLSHPSMLVPLS